MSVQRFFAQGVLPEPWDIRTDLEAGQPPQPPFALVELAGPAETSGAPATQDLIVPITVNLYLSAAATREAATDAALDLREQIWQAVKWGPDPKRPTTDRIPLYCYEPRIEWHRFTLPSDRRGDPFLIQVGDATTVPIAVGSAAADVAVALTVALRDAGMSVADGDITGIDRGACLWDIFYGGSLAGVRIGDPMILTDLELVYSGDPDTVVYVSESAVTVGDPGVEAVNARTMLQGAPAPWRAPSDYMKVSSFSQNTVRDQADPKVVMIAVDLRLTFGRGLRLPLDTRILQSVSATAGSGPEG